MSEQELPNPRGIFDRRKRTQPDRDEGGQRLSPVEQAVVRALEHWESIGKVVEDQLLELENGRHLVGSFATLQRALRQPNLQNYEGNMPFYIAEFYSRLAKFLNAQAVLEGILDGMDDERLQNAHNRDEIDNRLRTALREARASGKRYRGRRNTEIKPFPPKARLIEMISVVRAEALNLSEIQEGRGEMENYRLLLEEALAVVEHMYAETGR